MSVQIEEFRVSIIKFPVENYELFLNIVDDLRYGPGINRLGNFAMPLTKWYRSENQSHRLKYQKHLLASSLQAALHGYATTNGGQRETHFDEIRTLLRNNMDMVKRLCIDFDSNRDEVIQLALRLLREAIDDEIKKDLSEYQPLWPRGKSVFSHIHDVAMRKNMTEKTRWVAAQGCASLTMNPGIVAYLNNLTEGGYVYLREDCNSPQWNEISWRKSQNLEFQYPCIFKVKHGDSTTKPLRIGMMQWEMVGNQNLKLSNVEDFEKNIFTPEEIEFAVAGQLMLKKGRYDETTRKISHNFPDLRHKFLLPQLENGKEYYFGHNNLQENSSLREDAENNRLICLEEDLQNIKIALNAQELNIQDTIKKIETTMINLGYRVNDTLPHNPGEFRIFSINQTIKCEVVLLESYYPRTVIGLDESSENLYLIAATGKPSLFGLKITSMAELLHRRGLYNAIIIDHGYDVFQWYLGEFRIPMATGRDNIRAAFVVGAKQNSDGQFPKDSHQLLDFKERVM